MALKKLITEINKTQEDLLFHFTPSYSMHLIIRSNRLKAHDLGVGFRDSYKSYFPNMDIEQARSTKVVSLTRNPHLKYRSRIGFIFKRSKLKNNFKLYPVVPKDVKYKNHQDKWGDQQWGEEVIIGKDLKPLDRFCSAILVHVDFFDRDLTLEYWDSNNNNKYKNKKEFIKQWNSLNVVAEACQQLKVMFVVVDKHGIVDHGNSINDLYEFAELYYKPE